MSEWLKTRASSGNVNEGGNGSSQQSVQGTHDRQSGEYGEYRPGQTMGGPNIASSSTNDQVTTNPRTFELPPLAQTSNPSGGNPTPASRVVGVSSILNPAEPDEAPGSRRRKASELESSSSSQLNLPPLEAINQRSHSVNRDAASNAPNIAGAYGDRRPRRILTPRSPSLRHSSSLGQLNPPSVPYTGPQAQFAVSPQHRAYAIEPGTAGAPPLPTPPAAIRQSYGFTAPPVRGHSPRRVSAGIPRGIRPTTESTSPRSSYSSYSHAERPSPNTQPAPAIMPTLSSAYQSGPDANTREHRSASTPISGDSEHQRTVGVPISSSGGHNVYQMMTLETTSGTVQLPVDVQAASRVADEKRRRNAGASARFRQRRKEKEKEASTTISRLEQQVKELSEDADFYKRERDYFKAVVLQVPGGDRHFPRPQSPRHRRSTSMAGYRESGNTAYGSVHEPGNRSPGEDRSVRRRTSTLSLPQPQPPTQNLLPGPGPNYPPGFAQQHYGQAPATRNVPGPMPPAGAPQSSNPGTGPLPTSGPPQLMQAAPQTGPWNPYADRRPPGSHLHRDSR